MRLWSLHPKYLDSKGIVALWREALLAQKVLEGKTKGYTNHPQLSRFKQLSDPISGIRLYLKSVHEESKARDYNFDYSKIGQIDSEIEIAVTDGQLSYEWNHLKRKLWQRDRAKHSSLKKVNTPELHPLFFKIPGEIEDWELI